MRRRRLASVLAWACLWAACGEPPFEIAVTFAVPVEIEAGAPVRYQEVVIGRVTDVGLGQPRPDEPAQVELSVVIDSQEVVLREADVIEVASGGIGGEPHLVVLPAEEPSPPLAPGARVAGRPPLAARVEQTAEEALARVKAMALEQAEILADTLADQIEIGLGDADAPQPETAGTPPASAEPEAAPSKPTAE